jgi:hypothetical protein
MKGCHKMGRKIYKYFGPELFHVVLKDEGASFKCSLPESFNDPYELFLTVDLSSGAGALACYQEAIGSIPQQPVTCFSRSPAILPMWAHYGKNVEGFVVEIDEDRLREKFPDSVFSDVKYQDDPDEGLTELLYKAHFIGKPRYTYLLQRGVINSAYFTKRSCWSYEMERRMVVGNQEVHAADNLILVDVPKDCITSVIIGARGDVELVAEAMELAKGLGCAYRMMKIGRSSAVPYFVDDDGIPYIFDGDDIVPTTASCENCVEPISTNRERCSWCEITAADRHEAANRNPYRLLDRIGKLDSYISSMDEISRRRERGT